MSPGEIIVVPRGIRFNVTLMDGAARGYVLEVFQGHFVLPDLGPIGGGRSGGGGSRVKPWWRQWMRVLAVGVKHQALLCVCVCSQLDVCACMYVNCRGAKQ